MINKSPATAYLTGTVLFPGTQAAADAAEAVARTELGDYLSYAATKRGLSDTTAITVSGGNIIPAPV